MPKVNYHVLKDTELRKYCRDLNLPCKGDREVLVWRHRQYAMRHNACCDGMEPPDKAAIIGGLRACPPRPPAAIPLASVSEL